MKKFALFLALLTAQAWAAPSAEPLRLVDQWVSHLKSFDVVVRTAAIDADHGGGPPPFRWRADGARNRWESLASEENKQLTAIFDGEREWVKLSDERLSLDLKRLTDPAHPLSTGYSPIEGDLFIPTLDLPHAVEFFTHCLDFSNAELRDKTWVLTGAPSPTKMAPWVGVMGLPVAPSEQQYLSTQVWECRIAQDGSPLGVSIYADKTRARGISIDLVNVTVNGALEMALFTVSDPGSYPDATNTTIFGRLRDALSQSAESYQSLVKAHPDWPGSATTPGQPTLLHFVAQYGNAKAARALASPPEWFVRADSEGHNPVMLAVLNKNVDMLLYFCERPADLRKGMLAQQDRQGNTALHLAARSGIPEFCQLLLKAGAARNARNRAGKRPADLAVKPGLKKLLL